MFFVSALILCLSVFVVAAFWAKIDFEGEVVAWYMVASALVVGLSVVCELNVLSLKAENEFAMECLKKDGELVNKKVEKPKSQKDLVYVTCILPEVK